MKTIAFFATLLILAVEAHGYNPQEGNVTATLGPYFYKTNYSGSKAGSNPLQGGVGLIGVGDLSSSGAVEVAFFHLNKLYFREGNDHGISKQLETFQVNLGYRFWISSRFSATVAFASTYGMSEPKTHYDGFPVGQSLNTSADDIAEYGFDFSAQTELWQEKNWSLVLEGHYMLTTTSQRDESADHYGALLGLRYIVQKKNPQKSSPADSRSN